MKTINLEKKTKTIFFYICTKVGWILFNQQIEENILKTFKDL